MLANAKGKQQQKIRQLQCQEQRIDYIPLTFQDCCVNIFSDDLSRNNCKQSAVVCVLYSVPSFQSAFCTQSVFYTQSAVHSPCFILTGKHSANIHTVCMHVQFKNIKRSVPAIQRIVPFPLRLPHHREIIIPGHNQQCSLTLTKLHQLQIPATIARIIQRKCECNANIGQEM